MKTKATSLTDLYIRELQDMYNAEKQLIKALPKMVSGATAPDLSRAFDHHLGQTKEHLARLERILGDLGAKTGGEKCEAMEGLVTEGEEAIKTEGEENVRDAGIIIAAQKVEHYEIAGYGSLCALAKCLNRNDDASLLHQTLEEERAADTLLTRIAEGQVNANALK